MEVRRDFLEWLGPDISATVLMLLDDPADLVRAGSVSRSWRRFVIHNGLCKNLCLRMFPELSVFSSSMEERGSTKETDVGSSTSAELDSLEMEYRIYGRLSYQLSSSVEKSVCNVEAICASSTDNFPDESIDNTLEPCLLFDSMPSYWSSKGQRDPQVPEMLTYRLSSKLCLVDEIRIQPFRAFFQYGYPIYSAQAVRFKMGHSRVLVEKDSTDCDLDKIPNEEYIWTYISPEFPMLQENSLQSFKLSHPAVCIGGILQIELLGRVQQQEVDNLYYICICYVEIIGQPLFPAFNRRLSPAFDAHIPSDAKNLVLKYFPDGRDACDTPPDRAPAPTDNTKEVSGWHAFGEQLRLFGGRCRSVTILGTSTRNAQPAFDAAAEDDDSDLSD